MTTLEKIRAEICKAIDDNDSVYYTSALHKALQIIDKYAEQESTIMSHIIDRPCDACEFHKASGCSEWECVFDSYLRNRRNHD